MTLNLKRFIVIDTFVFEFNSISFILTTVFLLCKWSSLSETFSGCSIIISLTFNIVVLCNILLNMLYYYLLVYIMLL